MKKVYVVGGLANPRVATAAISLRARGFDAFDAWYSAGPEADMKHWEHCKQKGMDLISTLQGHAAQHVFQFDTGHIQTSDAVVSIGLPGKSASWELGYAYGLGKPTFVLHEGAEPERLDVMLAGACVVRSMDSLEAAIRTRLGMEMGTWSHKSRYHYGEV